MLGGGNGACSTCSCLLQVVRALPMFTFCFSGDVLSAVQSQSFSYSSDVHDIVRLPDIDQGKWLLPFFLGTLDVITHVVMQVGAFASTYCLPSGFHRSKNKCARREYVGTMQSIFCKLVCSLTSSPALGFAVHMS